ncbi:phosphodiesterase [Blastomonas sp. AAP25]|uniref:alkaline phosphatase family protein n=1 Tax=Blastomonas sp. AAP25 TaxID=1523416 RepID=UPI0006B8D0ED|nr:ectonucleotide pyrophosphatase/phosphodiesterase [Blastomonas sp. AAP25]KPF75203.1 phosphodiesterase [Blastomonas sp. AAP25]
MIARLLGAAWLCVLALVHPALAQDASPPVTILISIDGMRPDYLDRGLTPNLTALKAKGVAAAMRPSFPSKTFPNHYTIVTGKRPDRNGIVGNSMIDPMRPGQMFSMGDARQALDPFWWIEAEPVWVTAEKAGLRTATMFWPGSEVAHNDVRPRDWMRFDQAISNEQRVNTVLDWMRRPANIRPRLVTMYFDTVDTAGHRFGPDRSPELDAAISEVDSRIGELVRGIEAMGVAANFIITADHGMAQTAEDRVIQLDDILPRDTYIAVETGPYAAIEPAAGTDSRVFDALLQKREHIVCYRKEELPSHLHYGKNPRVAAIICIASNGWTILAGPPRHPVTGGAHGYDPANSDMHALFMAFGSSIRPTASLPLFDNVDVYPLIARLIGFEPLPSDGDAKTLSGIVTR